MNSSLLKLKRFFKKNLFTIFQIAISSIAVIFSLNFSKIFDQVGVKNDFFVIAANKKSNTDEIKYPLFEADKISKLEEICPDIDFLETYKEIRDSEFSYGDKKFIVSKIAFISSSFFSNYKINLVSGRSFDSSDSGNSVVISKSTAYRVFPSKNPIGENLSIFIENAKKIYKIIGIFDDSQVSKLPKSSDFYISQNTKNSNSQSANFSKSIYMLAHSKSQKLNEARTQILAAVGNVYKNDKNFLYFDKGIYTTLVDESDYDLQSLSDFSSQKTTLLILSVLLVFSSSFGIFLHLYNYTTENQKAIGMQRILGKTKFSLFRDLVLQILYLSLFGFVLGIIFSILSVPFIEKNFSKFINGGDFSIFNISSFVAAFLVILMSLLMSIFPAIRASRMNPIQVLREP